MRTNTLSILASHGITDVKAADDFLRRAIESARVDGDIGAIGAGMTVQETAAIREIHQARTIQDLLDRVDAMKERKQLRVGEWDVASKEEFVSLYGGIVADHDANVDQLWAAYGRQSANLPIREDRLAMREIFQIEKIQELENQVGVIYGELESGIVGLETRLEGLESAADDILATLDE
jgi:hypothetical protein